MGIRPFARVHTHGLPSGSAPRPAQIWEHLADDGSLAITILDRTDKQNPLNYVEVVQLYLQYKMIGAVMDGTIWWSGTMADVPFWMWRKDLREHSEARRLQAKAALKQHYPVIYDAVVRQAAVDTAPPSKRARVGT